MSIPSRPHWKKEWTGFAALVVLWRLLYAAVGWVIVSRGGPVALNEPLYRVLQPYLAQGPFAHWFVNPWFQWDTVSYVRIAMLGYGPDESIAFMPLYPLLIHFTAPLLGGDYLLAALLLSTLLCFITLILLYELLAGMYPARNAWQAVALLMAFPTAFFLLAGYTESLFLALVLGFWLLARRKRWGWAALLAGLVSLARLQGVILAPIMLWMMLVSLVERPAENPLGQLCQVWGLLGAFREKVLRSDYKFAWLAASAPVLTAAGYQLWLVRTGLGTITHALHEYWKLETVMPWEGIILFIQRLATQHLIYMDWIDLILFVVVLLASLIGLRRLDPAFSLYIWLTLAVLLTRGTPPHLLASYSRYFLALFPLFILPTLTRHKYLWIATFGVSFLLQITLVWIFLSGSWVA